MFSYNGVKKNDSGKFNFLNVNVNTVHTSPCKKSRFVKKLPDININFKDTTTKKFHSVWFIWFNKLISLFESPGSESRHAAKIYEGGIVFLLISMDNDFLIALCAPKLILPHG